MRIHPDPGPPGLMSDDGSQTGRRHAGGVTPFPDDFRSMPGRDLHASSFPISLRERPFKETDTCDMESLERGTETDA